MIEIVIATVHDIDKILEARYGAIKDICNLEEAYSFSEKFMMDTKMYFQNANQTTVLAYNDDVVIGCATLCYTWVLPTFDHPSGIRGHIMNVYTNEKYRGQGIAYQMMNMLIEEAKNKGVTELSLDATEEGKPLYKKCGFVASSEGVVLNLIKTYHE